MEIKDSTIGDIGVYEIIGRLDASTSKDLETKFNQLYDAGHRKFIFNLQSLEYISSAGLRVFLFMAKKLNKIGFVSLCSMQKQVTDVFQMSGFNTIFEVYNNIDDALKTKS